MSTVAENIRKSLDYRAEVTKKLNENMAAAHESAVEAIMALNDVAKLGHYGDTRATAETFLRDLQNLVNHMREG